MCHDNDMSLTQKRSNGMAQRGGLRGLSENQMPHCAVSLQKVNTGPTLGGQKLILRNMHQH